jgi:hypothetical protein
MRKIMISTLFAAGIGVACATGAAANPLSPVPHNAMPAISLVTPAQFVIITPPRRHRARVRYCRPVRQCYRTRHGRLVCRVRTVCTYRYR